MITYHINQSVFPKSTLDRTKKSTLFLKKSGLYILEEDLVIGSSSMGDKGKFIDFDRQVGHPPFHLGLWAGIAIMGSDITLDLNGHTIKMTENFQRQQRFFSLIELASQPFPKGIAGFIKEPICCHDVKIINGTLCNSSHHCIHGNFNENILFQNLLLTEFEVAGIAINGGQNITVRDVNIYGTSTNVTVLSTYSVVIDLKASLETIIEKGNSTQRSVAKKYLNHEIMKHLLENPGKDKYGITIMPVAPNGKHLPEGNAYGIYFNNKFSIKELSDSGERSHNITIEAVDIKNISTNTMEFVGICENDKILKDNKGNVIPWYWLFNKQDNLITKDDDYNFSRKFVIKMQLFCADVLKQQKTKLLKILDVENINTEKYPEVNANDIGLISQGGFDSRHHLMKGNMGIRIDGGKNVKLNSIVIKNNENYGLSADTTVDKKTYSEFVEKLSKKNMYNGNFSTGLSLTYCEDVISDNLQIEDMYSKYGIPISVSLNKKTRHCNFEKVSLKEHEKYSGDTVCLYNCPSCYENKMTIIKKGDRAFTKTYSNLNIIYA